VLLETVMASKPDDYLAVFAVFLFLMSFSLAAVIRTCSWLRGSQLTDPLRVEWSTWSGPLGTP
jgi:hypothetical protein